MSISTKALRFSCEFSLAYSEMYESTLLTHVCEDFMLSRMIMQSQEEMKSYSCSESEIKQIANRFLGNVWQHITDTCVQDFTLPGWLCSHRRRKATVAMSPRWNRSLTASLLAFSVSYFLMSWQKPSRFFATAVEYFPAWKFLKFSWCQLSAEQKFSRENFRSLLKIRENCKSFLTVKLLSFTV